MKMEDRKSPSMLRLMQCLLLSRHMPFSDRRVLVAMRISVRSPDAIRGYANRDFSEVIHGI